MFGADYEETEQDNREVLQGITKNFVLWKRKTLAAAVIFLASCALALVFMNGYVLHKYWNSFGKFFPLMAIGSLFFLTHRLLMFQFVWSERAKAKRDLEDLLHRRKV